jgi:hypothetical protein
MDEGWIGGYPAWATITLLYTLRDSLMAERQPHKLECESSTLSPAIAKPPCAQAVSTDYSTQLRNSGDSPEEKRDVEVA